MPIVSTTVGVVILHERLTWNEPVGAAVVLLAVAVAQGLLRRRSRHPATGTPVS
jgi:drug/metabolite transporter (DMT)-like permease